MLHQPAEAFRPSTDLPSPDAALIALSADLASATTNVHLAEQRSEIDPSREADAAVEAAYAAEHVLLDAIEKLPATTLAGLRVKAIACIRCHGDEPVDYSSFSHERTTDVSLAAGILRDLLAITA